MAGDPRTERRLLQMNLMALEMFNLTSLKRVGGKEADLNNSGKSYFD